MTNKARDVLEEFASSYSEVDVESLARLLEEIAKETAQKVLQRIMLERIAFVDDYGETTYAITEEKIKEIAAEYGVEVEE